MTRDPKLRFPLYEKAKRAGVLEDGKALIVAPTATGKSYIGREILRRAVRNGEPGVHAYLVPYRALAAEMLDSFQKELAAENIEARVRAATGDHSDPVHPEKTDILISTYERFAALLRLPNLRLGRVVVDEVHLVADHTRGPVLEGLLARMKTWKLPISLCALSAVVANPDDLGRWLGVPVVLGEASDRTVSVDFVCEVADDVQDKLREELSQVFDRGEQAIIFCQSKSASQRLARDLEEFVAEYVTREDHAALRDLAARMTEDDEDAQELLQLLGGGVAFHHAGLSRESRAAVEAAFREGHLKAIACTPTLAAGVNLPARLVVVRDVFRTEFVRGFPQQVTLSTGELLNMLGRAGRPGQVESGRGVALVKKGSLDPEDLNELRVAIRDGRGNPVTSRLMDSFDAFMRFLLAAIVDMGETTMAHLVEAVQATLSFFERREQIEFDRPFVEDIMEDLPSFHRITPDMRVERAWAVADGVAGSVVSGDNIYNFSLRFSGEDCTCPARAKWRRQDVCKHLACAIHYLLFGKDVDQEVRSRAMYACAHRFRKTLDLGTKMKQAVEILCLWHLIEPVPGGFQATPVGELAASSSLDLLLIRSARDRISKAKTVPTCKEIATWVVSDYFGDENKRDRWLAAVIPWLEEVDIKRVPLPERYRGDFERGLEDLGQLATLYAEVADSLGKREIAVQCRTARGCLQYGVAPELIPLASLRMPQLGRARCRFLYDQRNIRSLEDLANARPEQLSGPHVPVAHTRQWVETAKNMLQALGLVNAAAGEERDLRVDDFLAAFRVDQLSLFGEDSVLGETTQ